MKLIFDRRKRASKTKEGAIELRITYDRKQRFVTTGVRVLPKNWRNGQVVNRLDAYELQRTLDMFVAHARSVINDLTERGEFDMETISAVISGKQKKDASKNVKTERLLLDYFHERAEIRKYGRKADSQERYDRFLRWFEQWGGMVAFEDITELNVLKMDKALNKLKPYSRWNNYHRFLNSFILDAINEGLIRKNPYKSVHINKEKTSGIGKYLTPDELKRLEKAKMPTESIERVRDLFIFQTYTCLSYTDLASFDESIAEDKGGMKVYTARRGKTGQEFSFVLLHKAQAVLKKYGGKLPLLSNVKYNEYLKVAAQSAKIDKPITSHWARHTGATLLLNNGVDMEVVARILGHSSTKQTRLTYAKLLDDTIVKEMSKFQEKIS